MVYRPFEENYVAWARWGIVLAMGNDTDCVLVLTTLPVEIEPVAFGRRLVEAGLVACVTASDEVSSSVYRLKDQIEVAKERSLVLKTTKLRVDSLARAFKDWHPYDTPEFIVLRMETGGEDYLDWIRAVTGTT